MRVKKMCVALPYRGWIALGCIGADFRNGRLNLSLEKYTAQGESNSEEQVG